jgi:hypothetical protein
LASVRSLLIVNFCCGVMLVVVLLQGHVCFLFYQFFPISFFGCYFSYIYIYICKEKKKKKEEVLVSRALHMSEKSCNLICPEELITDYLYFWLMIL